MHDEMGRKVEFEPAPALQHLTQRGEKDFTVPLVDEHAAGRIYDPSLLHGAFWGALIGGLVLGWLGYAIAAGILPVAGLGQWAGTGAAGGAVTGGGVGIALGGLVGALIALYRMPPRHPGEDGRSEDSPAEHVSGTQP